MSTELLHHRAARAQRGWRALVVHWAWEREVEVTLLKAHSLKYLLRTKPTNQKQRGKKKRKIEKTPTVE